MSDTAPGATNARDELVHRIEHADTLAERRLVRRVLVWIGILVPIGAGFFALLIFIASRMGGVPSGAPVAMGAGIGVLSGVFFGMWAGVVASVSDIEHVEHEDHDAEPSSASVTQVGRGGHGATGNAPQ